MKKQVLVIDIDSMKQKAFKRLTEDLDKLNVVYWIDEVEV